MLKKWLTQTRYVDTYTGELLYYAGEPIEAPTFQMAVEWCNKYMVDSEVIGQLVAEVDYDTMEYTDHELPEMN